MRAFKVNIVFEDGFNNTRIVQAPNDLVARNEAILLEQRIAKQTNTVLKVDYCETQLICETEN